MKHYKGTFWNLPVLLILQLFIIAALQTISNIYQRRESLRHAFRIHNKDVARGTSFFFAARKWQPCGETPFIVFQVEWRFLFDKTLNPTKTTSICCSEVSFHHTPSSFFLLFFGYFELSIWHAPSCDTAAIIHFSNIKFQHQMAEQ